MTANRELPHLEILPVDKLILHEYHDYQRSPPLIRNLQDTGILRNPPIVMPLNDGSERYMVLDGANRTTALQEMGVPDIIVQVVQADEPGVDLTPWNHVIWGATPDTLVDWAKSVPEMHLQPSEHENLFRDLLDIRSLAMLQLGDGRIYTAYTELLDLESRISILNALVKSYADQTNMDRTTCFTVDALKSLYSDLSGLVLLPPVKIEEVLSMAGEGILMPPGSTRFTISGRALFVNFPLGILNSDQSTEAKNERLEAWLQESVARKRVRYYAEPIYIFDE